jgi:hypothetical protein
MATYLGKTLNKTPLGSDLASSPGFKWDNKGSMVFIGDKSVSSIDLLRSRYRNETDQ